MINEKWRECLSTKVLVLDGALGTMIQQYNLTENDFRGELFADATRQLKGDNDLLNLTRPDISGSLIPRYNSLCPSATC